MKINDHQSKKLANFIFKGDFVCTSPELKEKLVSEYPSTMSDDWFEHIITKLFL